jgi:hypothetical protein
MKSVLSTTALCMVILLAIQSSGSASRNMYMGPLDLKRLAEYSHVIVAHKISEINLGRANIRVSIKVDHILKGEAVEDFDIIVNKRLSATYFLVTDATPVVMAYDELATDRNFPDTNIIRIEKADFNVVDVIRDYLRVKEEPDEKSKDLKLREFVFNHLKDADGYAMRNAAEILQQNMDSSARWKLLPEESNRAAEAVLKTQFYSTAYPLCLVLDSAGRNDIAKLCEHAIFETDAPERAVMLASLVVKHKDLEKAVVKRLAKENDRIRFNRLFVYLYSLPDDCFVAACTELWTQNQAERPDLKYYLENRGLKDAIAKLEALKEK